MTYRHDPRSLRRYPHPSQRSAVLARNGAVATSQPLAAQAGLGVLVDGGNAIDAAIAAAAALTVVEPCSNGLGSDAFALVWAGGELHGINGSGRWPGASDPDAYRQKGETEMPPWGWHSVTVPGAIDTWAELHDRFGRLPIERLLRPAITYATQGFPVSPVVAMQWRAAHERYTTLDDPAVADWATVFSPDGTPPDAGRIWASPAHANCLSTLARNGFRDFYEGEIAQALVSHAKATGGVLSAEDLSAHRSEWVDPIGVDYAGHRIWEIPPNGQGIAALLALGIVSNTDYASLDQSDPAALHLQIEAMKLAFSDSDAFVADQEHAAVPVEGLLNPAYLASRAGLIEETAGNPDRGEPSGGGTVYLSTADNDGMMVSFIQSNYHGFGSGVVEPKFGVSLQNRGAGFSLDPTHPNAAAPNKRPRHTIIPGFITRGDTAVGPFGVMGGEMQPQGHLQVITGLLDHQLNPQAALDTPRWQVDRDWTVRLEPGASPDLITALEARGHRVQVDDHRLSFGRGQIILRDDDGVLAAGTEPRADGHVAAW